MVRPTEKESLSENCSKGKSGSICISRTEGDIIRIDVEALRSLLVGKRIGNKPVAFISIAGRSRSGKSFLLNFFIRYFREKGWENPNWIGDRNSVASRKDIRWKGGASRCSKGIVVFNEVYEVPTNNGGTMAVMIVDTQGLFDAKTPEIINKMLLTLSALMSSVVIFNTKEQINTQHLQYLKTCIDYAKASSKTDTTDSNLKLQQLVFLVRDFPRADNRHPGSGNEDSDSESDDSDTGSFEATTETDDSYTFANGKRYLKDTLEADEAGQEQRSINQAIETSFQSVLCFPMPHPGLPATDPKFKGKNRELNPEFLQSMKIFIEHVAHPRNLKPVGSKSKEFSADEIINFLGFCDKAFTKGIFDPASMIENNEDGNNADSERQFQDLASRLKSEALSSFDKAEKRGSDLIRQHYKTHLDEKCEEYYKNMKDQFDRRMIQKQEQKKRDTLKAFYEYRDEMREIGEKDPNTFAERHRDILQKICDKYGESIDTTELNTRVGRCFDKLNESNRVRYEALRDSAQRERSMSLSVAVEKLKIKTSELWKRKFKDFKKGDDLKKFDFDIKEEITREYWVMALTPEEATQAQKLLDKLRSLLGPLPCNDNDSSGKISGTNESKSNVKELEQAIDVASLEAQEAIKNLGGKSKMNSTQLEDIQIQAMDKFYDLCCKHLRQYAKIVKNDLDEQGENFRSTWDNLDAQVKSIIEDFKLELEKEMLQEFSNKHLSEASIDQAYKTRGKSCLDAIFEKEIPEGARKYFTSIAKDEMKESKKNMKERNESNRENRASENTSDKSFWDDVVDVTVESAKAVTAGAVYVAKAPFKVVSWGFNKLFG